MTSASLALRWRLALKPASWPKLLVPFALGQAIGVAAGGPSWSGVVIGLGFTVLDLVFIVLLNDWGDREVDALKRRMFPSSSLKTLPDRILPATVVLVAGVLAALGAVALAFVAEVSLDRPWLGVAALGALGIFAAYSLPPVRLNYRGGGELLEMLGVGVVLPWMNAYLQGGELFAPGLWMLPGFTLLALSSAVASGLADERSDRRGGKRTFVTQRGNRAGRRATEGLAFAGVLAWALAALILPWWVALPPAAIALVHALRTARLSDAAHTDAFAAQRRYKAELHRAIWRGALAAAMLLAWWQST